MNPRPPFDVRLLAGLLHLYPARFRETFGEELLDLYRHRRDTARQGSPLGVARCALASLVDTLCGIPLSWYDAYRRRTANPQTLTQPRSGEPTMTHLLHEAGTTARVLFTRQRSFTTLCVLTLALGLGAATAIFSVVHGVLLAPLPYGDPERIVRLHQTPPDKGWVNFSGPNFDAIRDSLESFDVIAAYNDYRAEGADLTGANRVERLRTLRVGAGYFEALGVQPLHGRTFLRAEEIPPGAHERDPETWTPVTTPSQPVVILSHGFWQRHFQGDPGVLGTSLELDRQPLTIVGVMPPRLGGHVGGAPDVWTPLDLAPGGQNTPMNQYLSVVGRLAPGVSLEQAQAELDRTTLKLRGDDPRLNRFVDFEAVALDDIVIGPSRSMLLVLFAAVGSMLAIACINVANLFLVRGLGRQRELGLRVALGAGRRRLFASALLESLWIGVGGGLLGLGVAWYAIRWLQVLRPDALPRYDALGLHMPVFAFSIAAVLSTVFVFGLVPALRAARTDVGPAFGIRGGVSVGGRRERRLRDFGVSVQVALSLLLLTAGGLLVRTFTTLHQADMGFDPERVLSFQLRLPDYAYADPERRVDFYDRFFAQLDRLPDLEASGATSKLPGNGHRNHWGFGIEGREPVEGVFVAAEIRCVAGRALEALSVPVLAGRNLGTDDRPTTERVILVNQALADAYFEGQSPLGERLFVGGPPARTIVGVVGDARHDPREEPMPKIYVPQAQFADDRNWDLSFVLAQTPGSTASGSAVRAQVEAVLADLDPRLVMYDVRPMAEVAAEPIARQRFSAQLMMVFATLSVFLAAVGLFGALAYSVVQRRAELGIRMALGADRQTVVYDVIFHSVRVFLLGAALGLGGVFAVGRWLESLLYGVQPYDPQILLVSVGTLALVTLLAASEPASRAARLDPAEILRES